MKEFAQNAKRASFVISITTGPDNSASIATAAASQSLRRSVIRPNVPSNDIAGEPATDPASAWLICDGIAGNERQVQALAGAMGLRANTLRIDLRAPWRWFAPRLVRGAHLALPPAQLREFAPPWPQFAIGCGRQSALLTRVLRTWSGGATFTVQILDPRIDPTLFDVVIAPQHDGLRGASVMQTLGALNPVDDAWLARAAVEFSTLQQLPQPRTALLVGGPNRELNLGDAWLESLVAELQDLLTNEGGSLMITPSRRTPSAWTARLHGAFRNGCVHFWSSARDGVNPYAGYLAHADRIVVTPDSVNMLSEACATGKAVFSHLPQGARGKLAAFQAGLRAQGRLHDLGDANISTLQPIPPLRETAAVAEQVWQRYRASKLQPHPQPAS
jgi:mitochondrial fission protein ELM1